MLIWLRNPPKLVYSFLLLINSILLICTYSYLYISSFHDSNQTDLNIVQLQVRMEELMKGTPILLEQNDSRILNYIKMKNIVRPPSQIAYNLKNPKVDPSVGQGQYIRKFYKNMENGFFVECGALDGETRSNTLYLEKNLHWKGLLIEANPNNFKKLIEKNRRAWSAHACLSIKPYPHEAHFLMDFNMGKIVDEKPGSGNDRRVTTVQCLPLFTLLSYLNVTVVDYFSLDVEGADLDVLKTIPFDSVLIKTISVEFKHVKESPKQIKEFIQGLGYVHAKTITHPNNLANDLIFVHPSLLN